MTKAPTPSGRGDPILQHTKSRIATLTNKNREILDNINKLHQSGTDVINAINTQLGAIAPHTLHDSESHVESLVNGLKTRQRRLSMQQQVAATIPRVEVSANGTDNGEGSQLRSTRTSAGDGLSWKYLSADDNNTDSEVDDANDLGNGLDGKESKDNVDQSGRRRSKSNPMLKINTQSLQVPRRPITPESSDGEFDMSSSHLQFDPGLLSKASPRARLEKSSTSLSRPSSTYAPVENAIEERNESSEPPPPPPSSQARSADVTKRLRSKSLASTNGWKRQSARALDDYSSVSSDAQRPGRFGRRAADDLYSVAETGDDTSSVVSNESLLLGELEQLRARINKLESERGTVDDETASVRRRRRLTNDTSPHARSPDSSQGSTTSSRRGSTSAQHQKHLQNAFDFFERAFTSSTQPTNDAAPPPSKSMAMVVSTALLLNQRLRGLLTQADLDPTTLERTLKDLVKTSDEQIRSLTECLLALIPLAQKTKTTRKVPEREPVMRLPNVSINSDGSAQHQQQHLGVHTARSISPAASSRPPATIMSSMAMADGQAQLQEAQFVDQFEQSVHRVSPIPPGEPSPTLSYYGGTRAAPRYGGVRMAYQTSPNLPPEFVNDGQAPAVRVLEMNERRLRRFSGGSHGSFSGTAPSSPSPPPLPSPVMAGVNNMYEAPPTTAPNGYYSRERRLSHRYTSSGGAYNGPAGVGGQTYQQRPAGSRPPSYARSEDGMQQLQQPQHVQIQQLQQQQQQQQQPQQQIQQQQQQGFYQPVQRPSLTRPYASRVPELTRRFANEIVQSPVSSERRFAYTHARTSSTPGEIDGSYANGTDSRDCAMTDGDGDVNDDSDVSRMHSIRRSVSDGSGIQRRRQQELTESIVDPSAVEVEDAATQKGAVTNASLDAELQNQNPNEKPGYI